MEKYSNGACLSIFTKIQSIHIVYMHVWLPCCLQISNSNSINLNNTVFILVQFTRLYTGLWQQPFPPFLAHRALWTHLIHIRFTLHEFYVHGKKVRIWKFFGEAFRTKGFGYKLIKIVNIISGWCWIILKKLLENIWNILKFEVRILKFTKKSSRSILLPFFAKITSNMNFLNF